MDKRDESRGKRPRKPTAGGSGRGQSSGRSGAAPRSGSRSGSGGNTPRIPRWDDIPKKGDVGHTQSTPRSRARAIPPGQTLPTADGVKRADGSTRAVRRGSASKQAGTRKLAPVPNGRETPRTPARGRANPRTAGATRPQSGARKPRATNDRRSREQQLRAGQRSRPAPKKERREPTEAELLAAARKRKIWGWTAIAILVAAVFVGAAIYIYQQLTKHQEVVIEQNQVVRPEVVACTPDMLAWTAERSGSHAGRDVLFHLTVTNTSETNPCTVDLGGDYIRVDVTSGEDAVWSSQHCAVTPESRFVLLDMGLSTSADVTWNGHRSVEGCADGQPAVGAGTYVASIAVDGNIEADLRQVFELTPPPAETEGTEGEEAPAEGEGGEG